jgi:hypothetical protein
VKVKIVLRTGYCVLRKVERRYPLEWAFVSARSTQYAALLLTRHSHE